MLYERYFKLPQILLIGIGLWPFNKSMFRLVQRICFTLILAFSIGLQFAKVIICRNDFTTVFQVLSFAVPCLVFSCKYATFCFKSNDITNLLRQLEYDWTVIKRKKEIEILEKYATITSLICKVIIIMLYTFIFVVIMVQSLPKILDAVVPLNESRPVRLLGVAVLFFDQEKYFYPILVHMMVALSLETTTVLATELFCLICVQHISGLFRIASLRIEHAFDCKLRVSISEKSKIYHANLVNAIVIHDRALELCSLFNGCLEMCYFFLLVMGICSLSINLFRFAQAGYEKNLEEFFLVGILVFSHLLYIFLTNLTAQFITNNSIDIYYEICKLSWYSVPLRMQKMITLMMQRSAKGYKFNIMGILEGSLEYFASIMSISLSYFTVLWSVQYS